MSFLDEEWTLCSKNKTPRRAYHSTLEKAYPTLHTPPPSLTWRLVVRADLSRHSQCSRPLVPPSLLLSSDHGLPSAPDSTLCSHVFTLVRESLQAQPIKGNHTRCQVCKYLGIFSILSKYSYMSCLIFTFKSGRLYYIPYSFSFFFF